MLPTNSNYAYSHNDLLEHFEINVSPAYHCNNFLTLEFFFVLKDPAYSKDSRPFRHQAMLFKQQSDCSCNLVLGEQ